MVLECVCSANITSYIGCLYEFGLAFCGKFFAQIAEYKREQFLERKKELTRILLILISSLISISFERKKWITT